MSKTGKFNVPQRLGGKKPASNGLAFRQDSAGLGKFPYYIATGKAVKELDMAARGKSPREIQEYYATFEEGAKKLKDKKAKVAKIPMKDTAIAAAKRKLSRAG